jgi:hypothetical protein
MKALAISLGLLITVNVIGVVCVSTHKMQVASFLIGKREFVKNANIKGTLLVNNSRKSFMDSDYIHNGDVGALLQKPQNKD